MNTRGRPTQRQLYDDDRQRWTDINTSRDDLIAIMWLGGVRIELLETSTGMRYEHNTSTGDVRGYNGRSAINWRGRDAIYLPPTSQYE